METKKSNKTKINKTQFKSYYVVWKRQGTRYVTVKVTGLNRTMQYGNKEGTSIKLKQAAV